jgi:type IV secretory pathway TraG/TraD family ATPase VirD4
MTAQISQLLGKVKRFDFKTMRHIEEDLLTPDNIRMLDDKSAIVIHGNKRPILLKKEWTPFFKIRKYRRRSKMKAPVIHYQKEGEGSPELIDLQEYAPREPQKEKEFTLSLDD